MTTSAYTIRRAASVLAVLVLFLPSVPVEALLPDPLAAPAPNPLSPTAAAAPSPVALPAPLAEAYRLASLHPDVRSALEYHAARNDWILLDPVVRDLSNVSGERAFRDALTLFGAAFGADAASRLDAVLADADVLPEDLAKALATLLYAAVDAQSLQAAALAPLTSQEVRALADGSADDALLAEAGRKANLPLTLQAASTLDAAVAAAEPILQKWGLLLQIENLAGRPITADAVAASLATLAGATPQQSVAYAEALLARPTPALPLPAEVPLPEVLLAYYAAMGVPLGFDTVVSLAMLRGADPVLANAAATNLVAGAYALAAAQGSADAAALATATKLAPEVARIATSTGATDADLALLAEFLAASKTLQGGGGTQALALVFAAVEASKRAVAGHEPVFLTPASHVDSLCVGAVCVKQQTYANGTSSLTVDAAGTKRTFWSPGKHKVVWDEHLCQLDLWEDKDGNGAKLVKPGEPANEQILLTYPVCDLANDVLFRDPFGYVVVMGDGSTVLDHRYGAREIGFPGFQEARTNAWAMFNFTFEGEVVDEDTCDLLIAVASLGAGIDPFGFSGGFGLTFLVPFFLGCFGNFNGSSSSPYHLWCDNVQFNVASVNAQTICVRDDLEQQVFFGPVKEGAIINPDAFVLLSLDLGGDDVYRSNAGGTLNSTLYEVKTVRDAQTGAYVEDFRQRDPNEPYVRDRQRVPFALAIDLGGDDRYEAARAYSQGASDVGVGVLYDARGNDTYVARDFSLAAANTPGTRMFFDRNYPEKQAVKHRGGGAAAVVDLEGNDNYTAGKNALAFANTSTVAILLDRAGNDKYASGRESQGFANATNPFLLVPDTTPGSADAPLVNHGGPALALFLEVTGDDAYTTTARRAPDGRTSDWAQGRAVNWGTALLLDLDGRDSGLMTNGEATVDSLLAVRFSTRSYYDKCGEPNSNGVACPPYTRRGSGGFGFAFDIDATPSQATLSEKGYYLAAPGGRVVMGEDPFWKLNLYIDLPGLLALGNEETTTWKRDFVLALDLGGNDLYENRPGAASLDVEAYTAFYDVQTTCFRVPAKTGIALGDSELGTTAVVPTCPKAKPMGRANLVALGLDVDGRDVYRPTGRGVGYGLLAVGLHYDRGVGKDLSTTAAADQYWLTGYSGGAGVALGVGILSDEAGNDYYNVTRGRALGFGERGGVGILLENLGDDVVAAAKAPLVAGAFHDKANAAFGLYLDADGADRYDVHVQAQGAFIHRRNDQNREFVSTNATLAAPPQDGNYKGQTGFANQADAARALFVDDGLAQDTYVVAGLAGTNRTNDKEWTQTHATDGTPAGHNSAGQGFDNLDRTLNAQILSAMDPASGNVAGAPTGSLVGPAFLHIRSILLSPSVEFTMPSTGLDPVPSRTGTVQVEVLVRAAHSQSVIVNAERLARFLLYEEAQRYTCNVVDPYKDPAKVTNNANLDFGNPVGGPHHAEPFYCGSIGDPVPPPSPAATPETSAFPAYAPVLAQTIELLAPALGTADVSAEAVRALLAEASVDALRGRTSEAAATLGTLLGVPEPRHPTEVVTQNNRIVGSEDISRVSFKIDGLEVARCTLSGAQNEIGGECEDWNRPGVKAWFANGTAPSWTCRSTAAGTPGVTWGCFELDWDTSAVNATTGALQYPDGNYELSIEAHYDETGALRDVPKAPSGDPTWARLLDVERRGTERLSDNYRYYPGYVRRILSLDNKPVFYLDRVTVGDFVPDDAALGAVRFQGYVSEPVRFEIWVLPPLPPGTVPTDNDWLRVYGPGFNETAPFHRLDAYNYCLDMATGQRLPNCVPTDAKAAHAGAVKGIPVTWAWVPDDPLVGKFGLRVRLWDRTHLPDGSPTRNEQLRPGGLPWTWTFWGDATPPVATVTSGFVPAGGRVGLDDVNVSTSKLHLRFDEDADAAANRGSVLERADATVEMRHRVTGAATSSSLTLTRSSGAVQGNVTLLHGWRTWINVTGVDRAGNRQTTPTGLVLDPDLEAPRLVLVEMGDRMQPTKPLVVEWEPPLADRVFGPDTVNVELLYSIVPAGLSVPANATWTSIRRVAPASERYTLDLPALGVPATLLAEPNAVALRVVAEDHYGNREEFDVAAGVDRKIPAGPVAFDTQPPVVANGGRLALATHDAAVLSWTFDERAPAATYRLAKVAPEASGASCSVPSGTVLGAAVPATTSDGGVSYRAVLKDLSPGHVYELAIEATDVVGNKAPERRYRFCTEPIGRFQVEEPAAGTLLRLGSSARLLVSDVRVTTGSGATGDTLVYNLSIEAAGKTYWLGETSYFEARGGERNRTFTFDTRGIPDSRSAVLVAHIRGSLNPQVPVRVASAPFTIDNSPPRTNLSATGALQGPDVVWYRGPVDLAFPATDAASAVAETWISEDNRTFRKEPTLRLASPGLHVVYYYSVDAAGNREAVRLAKVGVDADEPRVLLFVENGEESLRHTDVTVEIAASDGTSGVHSVLVSSGPDHRETFPADRLDSGALSFEWKLPPCTKARCESFVEVAVTDQAGNVAVTRQTLVVDPRAPALAAGDVEDLGFTDAAVVLEVDEETTARLFVRRATDRAYQARFESHEASTLHRVKVTGLFPATKYVVDVQLFDSVGNKQTGRVEFTTLADETPPGAVRNLAWRDPVEGYLVLDWSPAEDDVAVERYAVYRANGTTAATRGALAGHAYGARFLDTGVTPGLGYSYWVAAIDAAGNEGPLSEAVRGRATTRPALLNGTVTPDSGVEGQQFRYSVVYRDLDGDKPAYVRVIVNGKSFDMQPQSNSDSDVRQGVVYVYDAVLGETRLAPAHTPFRFAARAGRHPGASLVDGIGPVVVAVGHGSTAGSTFGALFSSVRAVPALAWPAVLLAVGAIVLFARRRSA